MTPIPSFSLSLIPLVHFNVNQDPYFLFLLLYIIIWLPKCLNATTPINAATTTFSVYHTIVDFITTPCQPCQAFYGPLWNGKVLLLTLL